MKATKADRHQKTVKASEGILSYAELLCTASTLTDLDRGLVPWFSDEIRMSDDPRVKWIDLSSTESTSNQSITGYQTSSEHLVNQNTNTTSEMHDIDAVSGHYLDHIEAVQQRDQKASPKRKRRSAKKNRMHRSKQANTNSGEATEQHTVTQKASKGSITKDSKPKKLQVAKDSQGAEQGKAQQSSKPKPKRKSRSRRSKTAPKS